LRPSTIAIGLLAATVALGLAVLIWPGRAPLRSEVGSQPMPFMTGERPLRPPSPGANVRPPHFDILRIEPDGQGAAQGRAEPLARVTLRTETGMDLGAGAADDRGEWVIMMVTRLAAGDHVLRLIAEMADGSGVPSAEEAVVALAEKPIGRPLVVLMSEAEGSRVLQSPQGPETRPLCLQSVDEKARGDLRLSGRADPGRSLNVYADGRFLAQTAVDDEGQWTLSLAPGALKPGAHRLRLDVLNESGAVGRRLEASFTGLAGGTGRPNADRARAEVAVDAEEQGWRITRADARQSFIFGLNTGTPLDPAPFLPGQVPPPTAANPPEGIMPAADR
jgi:hypothetical protein